VGLSSLKASLAEWTDYDVALFRLAVVLGVMGPGEFVDIRLKYVFQTDNPLLSALTDVLDRLVAAGMLERTPGAAYRWNAAFDLERASEASDEGV
jgi:hypothetical protein